VGNVSSASPLTTEPGRFALPARGKGNDGGRHAAAPGCAALAASIRDSASTEMPVMPCVVAASASASQYRDGIELRLRQAAAV
jgi:hypothetical protein